MSFIEALADALQEPLRNSACLLDQFQPGAFVGLPPAIGFGYITPASCQRPVAPDRSPILGGQCLALYRVRIDVRRPDGTIFENIEFQNVAGPVTEVGGEWTTDFFGNRRYIAFIRCPNDTEQGGFRRFGPFTSYVDPDRVSRSFIRSLTREDGQPDNCGDSPGVTPPPSPPQTVQLPPISFDFGGNTVNLGSPSVTFNPTINLPSFGGLHIPVNVRFSPTVTIPGGINFPIYLQLPSLEINPRISFFNIDLSPDARVPDTTTVFPPPPGQGGGGDVTLPTIRRLIGVNVSCTLQPGARPSLITDPNTGADLYVPYLGVVRFVPPPEFSSRLGTDVPIKTLNQFVPVPWFFGAIDYDILPNGGVTVTAEDVEADIADLVTPV